MQELLTNKGFFKFHSCGCPGKPQKWKSNLYPKVMVKIYTSRNNFELYYNNRVTTKGNANQLEQILSSYVQ
jgi:hypothetical protein